MRKTSVDDAYPHVQQPISPYDVEKIYRWFKDADHYVRIDFVVSLLENCCAFEYRFIAACLENMCQKVYKNLLDEEKKANSKEEIDNLLDSDSKTRYNLIIFLSLLRSNNEKCAAAIFNKIISSEKFRQANNYDASIESDSDFQKELTQRLLLFTLGSKHPAFSFHHRKKLSETARNLIREKEGRDKIAAAAAPHCNPQSTYIREQFSQPPIYVYPVRATCTNPPSPSKSLNNPGYSPTYTLQVTWSDHHLSHAKHTAEDFANLHNKVMQMVEQNSAAQDSLQKLKSSGFESHENVDNYLKCLFSSSVPQAIHQSETFLKFFTPRMKSRYNGDGDTDTTLSTTSTNLEREMTTGRSRGVGDQNHQRRSSKSQTLGVSPNAPRSSPIKPPQMFPAHHTTMLPLPVDFSQGVSPHLLEACLMQQQSQLEHQVAAMTDPTIQKTLDLTEGGPVPFNQITPQILQSHPANMEHIDSTEKSQAHLRQFSAVLKQIPSTVTPNAGSNATPIAVSSSNPNQVTSHLVAPNDNNDHSHLTTQNNRNPISDNPVDPSFAGNPNGPVPSRAQPTLINMPSESVAVDNEQLQSRNVQNRSMPEEFSRIATVDTNEVTNPAATVVPSNTARAGPACSIQGPVSTANVQMPHPLNGLGQHQIRMSFPANVQQSSAENHAYGLNDYGLISHPFYPGILVPVHQHLIYQTSQPQIQPVPTMASPNAITSLATSAESAATTNNLSTPATRALATSLTTASKAPLASDIVKGVASVPKTSPPVNQSQDTAPDAVLTSRRESPPAADTLKPAPLNAWIDQQYVEGKLASQSLAQSSGLTKMTSMDAISSVAMSQAMNLMQHTYKNAMAAHNPQMFHWYHQAAQSNQLVRHHLQGGTGVVSSRIPGQIIMGPAYPRQLMHSGNPWLSGPLTSLENLPVDSADMKLDGVCEGIPTAPPSRLFCSNCGGEGHLFCDCAEPHRTEEFRIRTGSSEASSGSTQPPSRENDSSSMPHCVSESEINRLNLHVNNSSSPPPQEFNLQAASKERQPRSSSSSSNNDRLSFKAPPQITSTSRSATSESSAQHITSPKQSQKPSQSQNKLSHNIESSAERNGAWAGLGSQSKQQQSIPQVPKHILQRTSPRRNAEASPRKNASANKDHDLGSPNVKGHLSKQQTNHSSSAMPGKNSNKNFTAKHSGHAADR